MAAATDRQGADIPDAALASALEFAVLIAAVGQKTRPPLAFPAGLKPFLKFHKLPPKALATVREVVEHDADYLRRLGVGAQPDLVDEVGMLWLQRPDGWLDRIRALLEAVQVVDGEGDGDVRAERRRREAAETAAARSRLEVVELTQQLAKERGAVVDLTAQRDRLAATLRSTEARVKELESGVRKRTAGEQAEAGRADAVTEELESLRARLAEAEAARDAALASLAEEPARSGGDRLRALLLEALAITGPPVDAAKHRRVSRSPIAIPGGVYGNSEAAAEHLLRVPGVMVLVDGYNVAKLGWPDLSLERQRERCVDAAESVAKRWGTDLHVVFDGAGVVGAHSRARRVVRVVYSPEGVLADDVLRAEVAALDPSRPVVVVTNDQAVVHDVKAAGANVITSEAFLAVARR